MTNVSSFTVTYDRESDVLYITARRAIASRGVEDEHGIVWRYDSGGDLLGATIVGFYDEWYGKQSLLTDQLSKRFHIPPPQVRTVIQHAFESRRN